MIYIREHLQIFMKSLTLKKIIIYTVLETAAIIAIGYFVTLFIPEFKTLTVDFICIIVIVDLFEMLSIIKHTLISEESYMDGVLHWVKFLVFTLASFVYILISLGLLPEDMYISLFFNLKITALLVMVLMLGTDLTIDKIHEYSKSEMTKIE